jgi:hypothetical protein
MVPDCRQSQRTQWLSGRMNGIRWQIQVKVYLLNWWRFISMEIACSSLVFEEILLGIATDEVIPDGNVWELWWKCC